jgi:predicted nucleotidyltransferase component of viral defense system
VISQRNISLLSNRLAADGGRRIREDVLERDYCLAWFLAVLSQSDLKTVLGFKGGTALKRCYFGDYRFSEDLDFTLLEAIPLEEILGRLEPVYRGVREALANMITGSRLGGAPHQRDKAVPAVGAPPEDNRNLAKVSLSRGHLPIISLP